MSQKEMTYDEALDVVLAVVTCCTSGLECEKHCPRYKTGRCMNWTDEEVIEAVGVILRAREGDL